jgi:hypothetical protein
MERDLYYSGFAWGGVTSTATVYMLSQMASRHPSTRLFADVIIVKRAIAQKSCKIATYLILNECVIIR